jgi:hypothetical protein
VPAGREPRSDVMLHRMGTVLEDTYAQNVKSKDNYQFPASTASATIRTFDGLVANTMAAESGDRNYVHYAFSVDESKLKKTGEDASGDKEAAGGGKAEGGKQAADDKPGVRREAENYNKQLSGWVYTIPDYKYDLLSETMDSLTKAASADKKKK